MSFGPGARQMVENVIDFMAPGATLTLRRDSTLVQGGTSAPVTSFTAATAAAAGASVLSISGSSMRGRLVAGAKFLVTGDPTVYTVTEDRLAVDGVLEDVPFTPVLSQDVAKFAPISFSQYHGDQAYKAFEAEFDRETASSTIDGSVRRLELAVPTGGRAPKEKDRVVGGFNALERVVHVKAHQPEDGYPVRWTVLLSSSPGVV